MSTNITKNSQIANRYAKALFLAAEENRSELAQEFKNVLFVLEDPLINRVFFHPLTSGQRKGELVRLMGLSKVLESFLLLVVEKGREALLPLIQREFERLVLEERNTAIAEVRSAVELSSAEQNELQKKLSALTGKHVIIRSHVDPGIGGGLVIQVDGKVLDASLKQRLAHFAQQLTS